MQFKKFQQGDKVQYVGRKFAAELNSSLGVIDAHVNGSDTEVVVSFGQHSFVMDSKSLSHFQGKVKEEQLSEKKVYKDDSVGGAEVHRRKPGGKRRNQEASE